MGNMGVMEWAIILLIVMVLFGSKKIPDLAKGLGQGIREFKKASAGIEDDEPKKTAEKTEEKKG